MTELSPDLDLMIDRVRRAGALAQHLKAQGLHISYKSDGSILTNADIEVDRWLKEALLGPRPDYGWLSEEAPDANDRMEKARVFVLDPIDGTMGFSKGSNYWTISLALTEGTEVIAAVVFAPDARELYYAGLGTGAFLNDEAIVVSPHSQLDGASGLGDHRLFQNDYWPEAWPNMHVQSRPSVAYRMVCVAAAKTDFTVALSPKRDWDVAAATLIINEAGGQVTDHLGNPYEFNSKAAHKPSVVAANPVLSAALLSRFAHLDPLPQMPRRRHFTSQPAKQA